MSTYQGMCGVCDPDTATCSGSPVLPSHTGQLTGNQRTGILAEATLYNHQFISGRTQFASGMDYIRYKKARILAGSAAYTKGRPPPSAATADLIKNGCNPL